MLHLTRNRKREYGDGGFTLVEIMVAVGIFAFIMLATVGIMITVIHTQERIARTQATQDNARFSLELITKEMRTGVNYQVGAVCAADGSEIHFTGTSGKRVYYLDPNGSGKIYRATGDIIDADQCANATNSQFNEFTGDQVFVERLAFTLRGEKAPNARASDGQAMAIITMKVRPDLNLQTTIVQRIRDMP
ncbi:MAG: prepilin-type N-terminal cleavage/methylation domain-containing protein [Candidatus Sungbacteria bacterium]|nr:prepilin-type N-terminal cleavage/methylation domain-containing protein [Candidatus Sungbacteria bacterium]